MILLFANNAESAIASPIAATTTSVQLRAGDGALFPTPSVGAEFFKLTFVDAATGLINEIVNVTQRVGDVLTIVRGQEGTTARAWMAGDTATNMTTAGTQDNFIQVQQAQSGKVWFSQDFGTPNSYVVAMTPAITTRIPGLFVRFKALNSNTGPSTINIGAGSFPIVNPDGSQLGAGGIIAGGIFEIVDDGTNYQLISSSQQAQSLAGALTTGSLQWRPTAESVAGWILANGTTIGGPASNASQLASALAENLFMWHWNNFSNAQSPVYTSAGVAAARGTNAAADYAANMQIRVLDLRGTILVGADAMGGAAAGLLNGVPVVSGGYTAGSIIGENLHTTTYSEMPVHAHSAGIYDPTHTHSTNSDNVMHTTPSASVAGGAGVPWNIMTLVINAAATGVRVNSSNGYDITYNAGGSAAHNNMPRAVVCNAYIKL